RSRRDRLELRAVDRVEPARADVTRGVGRPAVERDRVPGADEPAEPGAGAPERIAPGAAAVSAAQSGCDLPLLRLRRRGGEEVVRALEIAAFIDEPRHARAGDRELEDSLAGAGVVGDGRLLAADRDRLSALDVPDQHLVHGRLL